MTNPTNHELTILPSTSSTDMDTGTESDYNNNDGRQVLKKKKFSESEETEANDDDDKTEVATQGSYNNTEDDLYKGYNTNNYDDNHDHDHDDDDDGRIYSSHTNRHTDVTTAGDRQSVGESLPRLPSYYRASFSDSSKQQQMEEFKSSDSFAMAEDVYAFIVAAPFFSWPFLFSCYIIGTKYIVYGFLLSDAFDPGEMDGAQPKAQAVKFFLIPVAIAMQADLMKVYSTLANIRYSKEALNIAKHATKTKFMLAYVLRFIDGAMSLAANFSVMMGTNEVLNVFLNFAALHFLQDIDDVFYNLVRQGFFGDRLEHMATLCNQISWPRRVGNEDCWKSALITQLDSILFGVTFVLLLSIYIFVLVKVQDVKKELDGV